jgi:hypothetical protein
MHGRLWNENFDESDDNWQLSEQDSNSAEKGN